MIEQKIDELIEALNKLTTAFNEKCESEVKALLNAQSELPPLVSVEERQELTKEVKEVLDDAPITLKELKDYAKEVIGQGVKREDVKKIISDNGADSLAELDKSKYGHVYNALQKAAK